MPFYTSTPVLTNFTGADENPLSEGGNFTGPIFAGRELLKRVNNQCAADETTSTGTKEAYWTPTTFSANQQCFTTISTAPPVADLVRLNLRITTPGASASFCSLNYKPGTGWSINWRQGGVVGNFAPAIAGVTLADGDKMGFQVTDNFWEGYAFQAGVWTQIISAYDYQIVGAGMIGLTIDDVGGTFVTRLDDFGGGAIGAGGPVGWVKSS